MIEASTKARPPVEQIAPDAIRLVRTLDASVDTVWRYLTEAELRSRWFMGGTDATSDGKFDLVVDHDQLSEGETPYPEAYAAFKGAVWSETVIRFDPPRLLTTTFQGGKNGEVTYELFPEGEKTRLILTHSGIASPSGFQDFGGGWCSHLAVLEERLAGRGIPNFWELHARCRDAVANALG
jgi:uncharacterized protein YndB with AHSA1/START domain